MIVAVPWEGHGKTLESLREELAGKLVVDGVKPLGFDKKGAYALKPEEGSAAEQAAALLPDSRVCAAFNHVSAPLLADPEVDRIDLDVLICTEDRDAAGVVAALAARIPGMRGIYAGRLRKLDAVAGARGGGRGPAAERVGGRRARRPRRGCERGAGRRAACLLLHARGR